MVLTVEEVAERLKFAPYTVRELLNSGELTGFQLRPRGPWRVLQADLDAYIDSLKAAPVDRNRIAPRSRRSLAARKRAV